MSRKSRNIVLLVLCFVLVFSAMACIGGGGGDDSSVTEESTPEDSPDLDMMTMGEKAADALKGSPIGQ